MPSLESQGLETSKTRIHQARNPQRRNRLDALIAEEALAHKEESSTPPSPEIVAEWAKDLDMLLRSGSCSSERRSYRRLVKELLVMGRDEIMPTYRIPALVRAPGDQVVMIDRYANRAKSELVLDAALSLVH